MLGSNKEGFQNNRMTRKQQTSSDSDQHNAGYCEMCCQDYLDLAEHITSPGHIKLATDPSQFATLDSLIKETFHNNVNGDIGSNLLSTNRRILRSNKSPASSISDCYDTMGNKHTNSDKQQQSPVPATLSPVGAQPSPNMTNGHVTRSTTAIQRQQSLSSGNSNHTSSDRDDHGQNDLNNKTGAKVSHMVPLQEVQCNGISTNHCHLTRLSVKTESLQHLQQQNLSPTNGVDSNGSSMHHLRSKKQLWLPSNLLGTTAEDEGNPVRTRHEKEPKSQDRPMLSPNSNGAAIKNKRRKLRRKRLSVEEKLIEDNKSYYKVEVLNSKLRSTGYYMTQRELELNRLKTNNDADSLNSNISTNCNADQSKTEEKEPVVVRFKKVRKSELSLLSDEAESFMFSDTIRKDNDYNDEEDEEDDNNEIATETEEDSSNSSSSNNKSGSQNSKDSIIKKEEIIDESSMDTSCSSTNHSTLKRRRRTHAEMFIHDNLDYYKFDIQGSRLRLHSGLLQPLKIDTSSIKEDNDKVKIVENDFPKLENNFNVDIKKEESVDEFSSGQLSFSFENVPDSESWYHAFKRQDEYEEIYHPIYSDYPKTRLLYEYPSYEKQKLLYKCKTTTTVIGNKVITFRRKKRRRRFLKGLDDKPRKSPRCHASTLAILSSLKYRRSKKDLIPSVVSPEKYGRHSYHETTNLSDLTPSRSSALSLVQQFKIEEESQLSLIDTNSAQDNMPLSKLKLVASKAPQEMNTKELAENIEQFFYQSFKDNVANDRYYHILKLFRSTLMSNSAEEESTSVAATKSKRSVKSSPKSSSTNTNSSSDKSNLGEIDFDTCCLDVDPDIINEMRDITTTLAPGPEIDMSILIDNYKYCNSMERADYEHLHPRAVDALRAFTFNDGSCNSSDCGGSSTCELLGFTEDGRMLSKRRKRKKRNMTGWPKDKPRRLNAVNKNSAGSDFANRLLSKTSCINDDDLNTSIGTGIDEFINNENSDKNDLEVNSERVNDPLLNCKRLSSSECENTTEQNSSFSAKSNKIHPRKIKVTRSLSRTCSIDSRTLSRTGSIDSTVPLSEYSKCVMQLNSRQLRGSNSIDSIVSKSSPIKRRASSPEKRSPGRGSGRRRRCAARWSPWASRRGR